MCVIHKGWRLKLLSSLSVLVCSTVIALITCNMYIFSNKVGGLHIKIMMVSTKIKTSGINACDNPEKFMMVMGKIDYFPTKEGLESLRINESKVNWHAENQAENGKRQKAIKR